MSWYHSGTDQKWYNVYGGRGGNGTLILRFAAAPNASPVIAAAVAEIKDATTASFSGTVEWIGDGATSADLVLTVGGVSTTVATGLATGDAFAFDAPATPGSTYAWSLALENNLHETSAAASGSLAFPADDPVAITTSGATETRSVGFDTVAIFNNTADNGSFTVPAGGAWIEALLVGGGGAGGRSWDTIGGAGGGGAGGFVHKPAVFLEAGTYTVTVGAGGIGREGGVKEAHGRAGQSGGASSIKLSGADVLVAYGGTGGAGRYAGNLTNNTVSAYAPKGSTGGAGPASDSSIGVEVEGQRPTDPSQGNPGGGSRSAVISNASGKGTYWFFGGGGGAGAPGADGNPDAQSAGDGGDGRPCSITGEEVWYAGGGGAGSGYKAPGNLFAPAGVGGKGGGGTGQRWKAGIDADNKGVDGLGGGGGGGGNYNGNDDNLDRSISGHSGGSGTVIIRWRSAAATDFTVTPSAPEPSFTSAIFAGEVTTDGGAAGGVTVELGWALAGSSETNWVTAATGLSAEDTFEYVLTGLMSGTAYGYAFRASNTLSANAEIAGANGSGTFTTVGAGAYLVPGAATTGFGLRGWPPRLIFRPPRTATCTSNPSLLSQIRELKFSGRKWASHSRLRATRSVRRMSKPRPGRMLQKVLTGCQRALKNSVSASSFAFLFSRPTATPAPTKLYTVTGRSGRQPNRAELQSRMRSRLGWTNWNP